MATLRGEPVDRPAVNFYEIGGLPIDPADPDPYNIYNAPDWQPLLKLAAEHTDLLRMMSPVRARSIDPIGAAEVSRRFPGRLWRIYGPEYAAEPCLPPRLFNEYVVRYTASYGDQPKEGMLQTGIHTRQPKRQ